MSIDKLLFLLSTIRVTDIIDISIISYVFYRLFLLIKGTRATQLIKGILFIFVFAKLSGFLKLYTINWILSNAVTFGVVAGLVVFQPELRRILEHIGNNNILKSSSDVVDKSKTHMAVEDIVKASYSLAKKKIGALIVLQNKTGLKDIVETGILLNSEVSYELLMNIFIPNTPLHDGAVIVSGSNILAASCFLPLTDNNTISMELGTRHRAGLGISEKSDCIVIVVSEETGFVSICERGKLDRNVSYDYLMDYLVKNLVSDEKLISVKDIFQRLFVKNVESDDNKLIKEEIKKEVREEIIEDLKTDIKEEFNEIIENQGENFEKKN